MTEDTKIIISLSKQDYERLVKECSKYDATPETVIKQFVADLICSDKSMGSDERRLANAWFARSKYNF